MSSSNKGRVVRWATFLAVWTALAAARPVSAKLIEDTVAVVNGKPILLSEYKKDLAATMEYWRQTNPSALRDPRVVRKLREKTLEQLIDHEILFQQGPKLKLKVRSREIDSGIDDIKKRFGRDAEGKPMSEADAEAAFKKQLKADGLSFRKFRKRIRRQVLMRKVIDNQVREKMSLPVEKDVREYFDKATAYIASKSTMAPTGMDDAEAQLFMEVAKDIRLLSSERVRVSRILVKYSRGASAKEKKRARKTALAIKKRLDKGESFAKVAREESEDEESAAQGGDIGYVFRGIAPKQFEDVAFSLPVGEVSGLIATDLGYNIIRVVEKRASEKPQFEKFRDQLAQFLMNVRFDRKLANYLKDLKAKAVIKRHLQN